MISGAYRRINRTVYQTYIGISTLYYLDIAISTVSRLDIDVSTVYRLVIDISTVYRLDIDISTVSRLVYRLIDYYGVYRILSNLEECQTGGTDPGFEPPTLWAIRSQDTVSPACM